MLTIDMTCVRRCALVAFSARRGDRGVIVNMFASERASLDNRSIDCNALTEEVGIFILPAEERLTTLLASLRARYILLLTLR